jgi:two-component system, OmpR family, sensor histidine kinase KdpD
LLNDPTKKLPPESREELLEHIEIESDRMSRLIENLLLLARLEMGREPEKSPVSLERLLEHAREDFKRSFANRELRVEKKSDPGTLASDETTLGQVVFNLLSNAAKYSPDDKSIELVIENEAEDVVFRILDRGPGVRPEELGLIFESFYRSPSTARQATGKGIGLAVCRRLVESLGGRIWAQNRVGGGLEVAFSIPNAGGEESQGQQH